MPRPRVAGTDMSRLGGNTLHLLDHQLGRDLTGHVPPHPISHHEETKVLTDAEAVFVG